MNEQDFIKSCRARLRQERSPLYPCFNCIHLSGLDCLRLGISVSSPHETTCPGFEAVDRTQERVLDIFDMLLSVAAEGDRPKVNDLLREISVLSEVRVVALKQTIQRAIDLAREKRQTHGGLGDK